MKKIYLVVVDVYENEENSIVNICTTREKAEELKEQYERNCRECDSELSYHIDEVELDFTKEILWDCYDNSSFNIKD